MRISTMDTRSRRGNSTMVLLTLALVATWSLCWVRTAPSAAAAAVPWSAADPTFQPPSARPPTVGINYHPLWSDVDAGGRALILDQYAAAGVQWVRIDIRWWVIQPDQPAAGSVGAARFNAEGLAFVDERMAEIGQRGMKAQAMFYLPPSWSSGRGSRDNPAGNGVPRNFQDYADALAFAAQRWRSVAPVWEIWNEPDITDFWETPSPVQFAALLRAAYETAKNISPTTTFVSGPPTYLGLDPKGGSSTGQWIRKMYENGARVGRLSASTGRWSGSYDQIGIHPYQSPGDLPPDAPGGVWTMKGIPDLMALMASFGEAGVPLNASELGWTAHVNSGGEQTWERGVTEDQQAAYTLRGFEILGGFPQVAAAFVFTDRDFSTSQWWGDRFGLLRADLTKKPAYFALKCVASGICGPPSPPSGAPAAPTGVTATATSISTTRIAWNASPSAASYRVTRTATATGTSVQLAAVTGTSVDDAGLTSGATYRYAVTATNAAGSSPPSAAVTVTLPAQMTYVAAGASGWRINDTGSDLGTAWRSQAYDASAWRQGTTEIGYGDGDEATTVAGNRITYYFRRSFDAGPSIAGMTRLSLQAVVDDGAVLYLNGVELWRFNLPTGAITYTTRASAFIAGDAEKAWRTATLPVSALRAGNNVIAIEVHNDQPSSSDISMNLRLIAS